MSSNVPEVAGAAAGIGCLGLGCAMQAALLAVEVLFGLFVLSLIIKGCGAIVGG